MASLNLRQNNPYSLGSIMVFPEGDQLLDPGNPVFTKSIRDRSYTVEVGDTLQQVAFKAYGDSKLWWLIYYANPDTISDPFELEMGQTLYIPDYNNFQVTSL